MQNSLIINLALDMPTLETAFRSHYPNYTEDELISVLDNVRASYKNFAADIIGYYAFDVYKLSIVGDANGTAQLIISENPSPINEFCLRDMYTDEAQFEADKQAYIRELSMLRECLHRLIADAGLRTFTGGMLTSSSSGSIRFETEVNSFAAVETVIDDMAVHAKARRFSA